MLINKFIEKKLISNLHSVKEHSRKVQYHEKNIFYIRLSFITLSIVVGGLALSYAPFIERMQILGARRIDMKSQRATATINIRPARLITIKYDCTLAIKRDSLVRGKDEPAEYPRIHFAESRGSFAI